MMEQEMSRTGLSWSWRPRKRRREALDVFFEEGDEVCFPGSRPVVEVEEQDVNRLAEFPCGISGCCQVFDSISGYEVHYNSCHRHTCQACHRTLPSNKLLEIHLRESHDPLFQLTTGDKFTCLVEGCESRFESAKRRQSHLIKVHKYPASFRFNRAKQRPISSTPDTPILATPSRDPSSMDVSETTSQQRAPLRVFSHKVPQSICFGHGSSRGFQRPGGRRRGKHWHQTKMDVDTSVQIENVNMTDLEDALVNQ